MTENEIKLQQQCVTELLQLMQANPGLPVIPMVDSEICASDEFTSWVGSFGRPRLDELYKDDERTYLRSEDMEALVDKRFNDLERKYNDAGVKDEIIQETAYDQVVNYNWKKVITLSIDLPL